MPADPTSTGGALSSSPSRRHSIAATASPTRFASSLSGRDGISTDGVRSYGAALASVPDRTVPFPRQPAGAAAYADEPTRALHDLSQAPGGYDDGQYRYGKTPQPRGGPGAAALLQQHVANQWAFRANQQSTLPTPPPHLAQNQGSSEPQYGRRGSLHQPAPPASYSSSLSQSHPQPSAYVPYGFTRPSPAPHDQSSSDSSTAASTPVTVSMSSNTTPGTSSGSGANSRTRSSSANAATASSSDFGQSFYDPFRIKHRRRTSPAQLRILEHHFSRSPKPDLALRKQLAVELDMTPREVQVWVSFRFGDRAPGGCTVDTRAPLCSFKTVVQRSKSYKSVQLVRLPPLRRRRRRWRPTRQTSTMPMRTRSGRTRRAPETAPSRLTRDSPATRAWPARPTHTRHLIANSLTP